MRHSLRWAILYLLLGAVWQIGSYGRARFGRRRFEVACGFTSVGYGQLVLGLALGTLVWPMGPVIALIPHETFKKIVDRTSWLRRMRDTSIDAVNEDARRFCPDCGKPLVGADHQEHAE
jgi:hypothetical protein